MLDKKSFLEEFHLEEAFKHSGMEWDRLVEIYNDYAEKHFVLMQRNAQELVCELEKKKLELADSEKGRVHIIYGRAKDPKHLIEKIIRKVGAENIEKYQKIEKDNYREIIRDLIGIRVLVLAKEDWRVADSLIRLQFRYFAEQPIAYVCYGDREIFDSRKLYVEYTSKGYRSQHYIAKYKGCYVEVQARTLSEEVYGEFDHRVRYPYRVSNKFLKRYSGVVSKNTSELDDLISTCLEINEPILDHLDRRFKDDRYIEWVKKQVSDRDTADFENGMQKEIIGDVRDLVRNKMVLRKEY